MTTINSQNEDIYLLINFQRISFITSLLINKYFILLTFKLLILSYIK